MNNLPPHSIEAEEQVLGAALLSADAAERVVTDLLPEDFYNPFHAEIARAMVTLYSGGYGINLTSVQLELATAGIDKRNPSSAADLISLAARSPSFDARRSVVKVADCATRRRAIAALGTARAALADPTTDLVEVAEAARLAVGTIDMPILATEPDPDLAEFLACEDEYDWLVPGLMERGDRCFVTGVEGGGKSLLLRQMAVCFAAGVQPFTMAPLEPLRVMILDLENSAAQTRRWLRSITAAVRGFAQAPAAGMLRPVMRSDGLDLLTRPDVRWLYERFEANRPQLVIGGPLYKMHAGNPNDEGPAAQVAKVWDHARSRYGFGLVLEAHAGHGQSGAARDMRPYGASLWKRWPEFGLGLTVDRDDKSVYHLRTWRGSRDERAWPTRLYRGGVLPWTVDRGRPAPAKPLPTELLPGPDPDPKGRRYAH